MCANVLLTLYNFVSSMGVVEGRHKVRTNGSNTKGTFGSLNVPVIVMTLV